MLSASNESPQRLRLPQALRSPSSIAPNTGSVALARMITFAAVGFIMMWRTVLTSQEANWTCFDCGAKNGGIWGGYPYVKVGSGEHLCSRCRSVRRRSALKNLIISVETLLLFLVGLYFDERLIQHIALAVACLVGVAYGVGFIASIVDGIHETKRDS